MLLILVAGATAHLSMTAGRQKVILYTLIITAWGNIVASINSALTGGRGLSFTGLDANTLTYVLFMAAVFAVMIAFALIAESAWRDSRRKS